MSKTVLSTAFILAALLSTLSISAVVQAQPFDITTEQSAADQQAVITVKLATNNTVIIPPNGTVIEVPGNITQVDNDTVVVTPDNETVTELPGNVTVITPPEPEPCQCPDIAPAPENETALEPVVVQPAPGQEVITRNGTELIVNESQTEPIPLPEPGNGNQTASNNTGPTLPVEPDGNQTAPPVNNNNTAPPAAGGDGDVGENNTGTISPANFFDNLFNQAKPS